jgi:hypothetical protein
MKEADLQSRILRLSSGHRWDTVGSLYRDGKARQLSTTPGD